MAYATYMDVEAGFRTLTASEQAKATALLDEVAIMIDDRAGASATEDAKKLVSCRMVRRAIGAGGDDTAPIGSTQGSISALGYSQSWTMGNGSTGEPYFTRLELKLIKAGNKIGSYSPIQELVSND